MENEKVYLIVQRGDETEEEARLRCCKEEDITEADLDAGMVLAVSFVSPEDVKREKLNPENRR